MKEYIKGEQKFIVIKNDRGLYNYIMQEYSEICKCWNNINADCNYTKEALEFHLDIKIDF